jgi:hypothetical protein
MINNIMQIVVQETTADQKRVAVQSGTSLVPENTDFFNYDDLTTEQKATYDAFFTMVESLG